ncbi:MAG TPA: hypothetical protein VFE46_20010 [Pirellulales bacterium]|jgi:hypothetical protein|nr:hypothetical protein [Pirellulales bacterium]
MILAVSGLTLHLLPLLAALAVMSGAGSLLARWLQPRQPSPGEVCSAVGLSAGRLAWGWSYLLGIALVGLILQVPLLIAGGITHGEYFGALGLCTVMTATEVILRWRERRPGAVSGKHLLRNWMGWIGDLPLLVRMLAILCLADLLWFAAVESPITFDARSIYGLKARILYDGGQLSDESFRNPDRLNFNANYPLLLPVVEAALYAAQGSQQDLGEQLLFAGFVLAIASILAEEIRRFESPLIAAMWSAFFILLPITLMPSEGAGLSGSADFAVAAFATAGVIAVGRWLATPRASYSILAGSMLGAAILTKQEGALWLAAVGFAMLATAQFRRRWHLWRRHRTAAWTIGIAIGCALVVALSRRRIPVSPYFRPFADALHWDWIVHTWIRIPSVVQFTVNKLFAVSYFNLIWPFVAIGLLFLRRPRSSATVFLWRIVAVVVIVVYLAILTITPLHLEYQLRTAFYRLALQVLPLCMLVGAEQFAASGWSRQLQWIFAGTKFEQPSPSFEIGLAAESFGGPPVTPSSAPPVAAPQRIESPRHAA